MRPLPTEGTVRGAAVAGLAPPEAASGEQPCATQRFDDRGPEAMGNVLGRRPVLGRAGDGSKVVSRRGRSLL